ncbi:probable receptor-like protein kinase At2g42960 [Phragmites australis]|uniref:probable receptor-like protein kinase At2g42960 n=1 Tax=Phragmites australis TaxID=29695 RepID=UPI002D789FB4|nr:probable receptor-like protein kinase At2g42960 [Phragmites australis]XP_062185635.1 probable receptor-like protein kinase At2g42960 [Phragmites australis]
MQRGYEALLGCLTAAVIVGVIAVSCHIRKKARKLKPSTKDNEFTVASLEYEETICKQISIKDIYTATEHLSPSNVIGQGIAGKVYRGVLANGWPVAVKHIIKNEHAETFLREVTSLSHVRHPNLVSLRGYCDGQDECFLVYELCINGNLSEWLFGKDKNLSWIQRLQIALGSACGLWFLHIYPEGCIVHRDIKPTNILLGLDMEPKLSDFGLSRVIDLGVSHVSSEVRGTFGYVDPEYRHNHKVNAAGDVYSFGMVLLQLLSGKRAISIMNTAKPMSLDKMASALIQEGNVLEFADPRLNGEYSTEAFDLSLNLALSCTGYKKQRPSMEQVVSRLEKALEISMKDDEKHNSISIVESLA